jgi:hypothetical protein
MSNIAENFKSWAQTKLGSFDCRGDEICINSIFTEDAKKKMWCNPKGGKNKIKYGVYHCWKTGKKGTLVGLVMDVEKCNKNRALEILGFQEEKMIAPESINFDFSSGPPPAFLDYESTQKIISFPPSTFPINIAPSSYYNRAKNYLNNRKIPTQDFFVCTSGKFENRVLIPYFNSRKELVYYNGRSLGTDPLRYRGPSKDIGVGKEDVVYFPEFPEYGDRVFLCEGELDAYSLHLCGLKAAAVGGKNLGDKQAIILAGYRIVFAFDADEAGQNSLPIIKNKILQYGNFTEIETVSPPAALKDWNNLLVQYDPTILNAYITHNTKNLE